MENLDYLGFVIGKQNGGHGISPNPKKIKSLMETKVPQTAKLLKDFAVQLVFMDHFTKICI